MLVLCLFWFRGALMVKKVIRLFVGTRKQGSGSYIASVPLLQLRKFSEAPDKSRRWSFEDGWLILEAF
jgi:hypothetical protein